MTTTTPQKRLAIDVGGVLIAKKDPNGADTNFETVQWLEGALDAVKELSKQYDLYSLSFCGKKTEQETRDALRSECIDSIPETNWIFTRKREHKVVRMKELNIPILIDDTREIIDAVCAEGLQGIHFGSEEFPNWNACVKALV
jgi:hypothetical protein